MNKSIFAAFALAVVCMGFSNRLVAQTTPPCELMMDVDQDGVIGANDLLGLLAVFGNTDLDLDCIWDFIDPCVNGEGDCVDEINGPCEGLNSISYNDFEYALIEIGGDCWFAENLRTEVYSNGDTIPLLSNLDESLTDQYGARAKYKHAFSAGFFSQFGYLYSGFTIRDSRNICPSGFHPSSDVDWQNLERELGLSEEAVNSWLSTIRAGSEQIAPALKSECAWDLDAWGNNNSTNSTGLSITPSSWYWNYSNPEGFNTDIGNSSYWTTPNIGWQFLYQANIHPQWYEHGNPVTSDDWPYIILNDDTGFISSLASRQLWTDLGFVNRPLAHPNLSTAVRCVKNQGDAGDACDDGNPFTFNDVWQNSGFCEGTWSVNNQGDGPCAGEMFVDYDTETYLLVELDGRCWFRENLHTRIYTNGDSIPFVLEWSYPDSALMTMSSSPYALYPEEYYYNYYVAQDSRGVCPNGWSIPNSDEWQSLISAFGGMEEFVANNLQGPGWNFSWVPEDFSNSGGFSVLKTGHIFPQSNNHQLNFGGVWASDTWSQCIGFPFCLGSMQTPNAGLSLRCIKDL